MKLGEIALSVSIRSEYDCLSSLVWLWQTATDLTAFARNLRRGTIGEFPKIDALSRDSILNLVK